MANLCIKTPSSAILVLIFQLLVLRPRPSVHPGKPQMQKQLDPNYTNTFAKSRLYFDNLLNKIVNAENFSWIERSWNEANFY